MVTYEWKPVPGSPAASDAEVLPSPDPAAKRKKSEPPLPHGQEIVTDVIRIYMTTAAGHLRSLAALLDAGEVQFSPGALVRSVIENCSRVFWILGELEDETGEDRLRRSYLEELNSAARAKAASGRMGTIHDPIYMDHAAKYRRLRQEVAAHFNETGKNVERGVIGGDSAVDLTAGVANMFATMQRAGSSISEREARGIYEFLSSLTHPTLYSVRQMEEFSRRPDGTVRSTISVDAPFLSNLVRVGILSFWGALGAVAAYYGRGQDKVRSIEPQLDALMPGFFN